MLAFYCFIIILHKPSYYNLKNMDLFLLLIEKSLYIASYYK